MIKIKSRLNWNDVNWAKYLKCPKDKIPEYREWLEKTFVPVVEVNKKTGGYRFAMYRYDIAPSGFERWQLFVTGPEKQFKNDNDAVRDANKLISVLEFTDFWAKMYDVPKKVLQMRLIIEK
ncbi:MAG: hypothetical protein K5912_03215 [Alphaproteobacteria bacterium]|nr:hypothetical protein [Alphaproteobacteria bacterium]